jgi:pimeloyl-ACP methyl ester carboxylesterase
VPATATSAVPATRRLVHFQAGDGMMLNLVHVQGERTPHKGPVLLVHGAGVRANIFQAPVRATIVDLLLDAGYDVWMENWRASIDFAPNPYTLDQAAVYDHPRAVEKVVQETGAPEIKAIIHCQGSTSFMMSAVAGLVPRVTSVVSNAVSLHPVVPLGASLKHRLAVPIIGRLTPHLDAQWGRKQPHALARALNLLVNLTHHECDRPVCKWSSFIWGLGFPTLWRHENLNDETHAWLENEFGTGSLAFFRQIGRCLRAGHLVSCELTDALPADFTAQPAKTQARFAFFAGEENRCFLYESQVRTHAWFEQQRPGCHSLNIIPRYAHLDVFMGKNAYRDVLPLMVEELDRPN